MTFPVRFAFFQDKNNCVDWSRAIAGLMISVFRVTALSLKKLFHRCPFIPLFQSLAIRADSQFEENLLSVKALAPIIHEISRKGSRDRGVEGSREFRK